MKSTVFRYALYSVITLIGLSAIHLFILAGCTGTAVQEVMGYLSIVLAMIFVYLGIRHYRNRVNNGYLSFGQGLKVGLLITLVPAVAFGLFDILYTEVLNPQWFDEYFGRMADEIRKNTAPEKIDAALKKLNDEREMFSNPVMQFLLMTVTVFIIGFIATIISSLTLMKKRKEAIA